MEHRAPRAEGGNVSAVLIIALLAMILVGATTPGEEATYRGLRVTDRFGFAQICPVSSELAFTAAHVVDPRPFDDEAGLWPVFWVGPDGLFGFASALRAEHARDLSVVKANDKPFPFSYGLAVAAPKVGEKVLLFGHRFREDRALDEEVTRARIIHVTSGYVSYIPTSGPGSSGSCVLNGAGEVIAINAWGVSVDKQWRTVGFGFGVWGSLVTPLLEHARRKLDAEKQAPQ